MDKLTGNKSKSVDMAVGLDNCRFLFIELKLNAKKVPQNIKIDDLKSKIDSSKKHIETIENTILVYCDRQKQRTYLEGRTGKTKTKKIEELGMQFMTLKKLKETFF